MLSIAGDAGRDVASNATASSLVAMMFLLVASGVGAWWLYRNTDRGSGPLAWFAALGSIAACLSLTLARDGAPQGFRPADAFAWVDTGWDRLVDGDLLGSSQFVLNVALFVPAGLAWTWVTRRPAYTVAGLGALSMLIESVQAVAGVGGADITDVVANSIGGALGVAVATVVAFGWEAASGAPVTPSDARRRAVVAAGLVIALAVASIGLLAGADRRQARIHAELEQALGDTHFDEIAAVLVGDADDPERLAADARFTDGEQIFSAISVRADGFRYTDDLIELRWPALFFGFRRCVYVAWTRSRVVFRNVSGSACTDFIG